MANEPRCNVVLPVQIPGAPRAPATLVREPVPVPRSQWVIAGVSIAFWFAGFACAVLLFPKQGLLLSAILWSLSLLGVCAALASATLVGLGILEVRLERGDFGEPGDEDIEPNHPILPQE